MHSESFLFPSVRPELGLEELVLRAKPAVLDLKGSDRSGTGFFVTDTGVVVTNAHVARDEGTLFARLPSGAQLEAKAVFLDAELDILLLKVDAQNLPTLALADAAASRQGENVAAIGKPGDAMLFSVTKGIVGPLENFPMQAPAPGFRPTPPSIPATAVARSSTCAAKSSASVRSDS